MEDWDKRVVEVYFLLLVVERRDGIEKKCVMCIVRRCW